MKDYASIAKAARLKVIEMIYKAQVSHIGSNFSCIDIAAVLYENVDLAKDKIIWSKGWAAATAYYFLAEKGVIPKEDLETFCIGDSKYVGLVEPAVQGIDFAGGSMGMGLPAGVGFALAKKLKHEDGRIFVIMSDGEMQIGTTWESALVAAQHKLDNLEIWCDANSLQAMGLVKDVLDIEPLEKKFKSFEWNVFDINGHDYKEIEKTLFFKRNEKPTIVIARTIKGFPISFMSGNNIFHYKHLSSSEYEQAMVELNNEKYKRQKG